METTQPSANEALLFSVMTTNQNPDKNDEPKPLPETPVPPKTRNERQDGITKKGKA